MKIVQARRELSTIDFFLQYHANDCSESCHSAIMMAVKSLEALERIKDIIDVPFLGGDEERYELICKIVEGVTE